MTKLGGIMTPRESREMNLSILTILKKKPQSEQILEQILKDQNGPKTSETYQGLKTGDLANTGPLRIWLKSLKILNQENMSCHSDGIVNRVHKFGILVPIFKLYNLKYTDT